MDNNTLFAILAVCVVVIVVVFFWAMTKTRPTVPRNYGGISHTTPMWKTRYLPDKDTK